mgnify:CR=1 FL=1
MSKLILAGHELDGDLPQLKNFREPPYWDASSESVWYPGWYPGANAPIQGAQSPDTKNKGARRYAYRPSLRRYYFGGGKQPPLDAAKASINKFIFHHDGCPSSEICWKVLQNERGLSCHFLIDGDGTIYQTADLALMAFHAAQYNLSAIGLELNNRGDAKKEPDYYKDRRTVACKIGNSPILAWDFTDAQYQSMNDLARLLGALGYAQVDRLQVTDIEGLRALNTVLQTRSREDIQAFLRWFTLSANARFLGQPWYGMTEEYERQRDQLVRAEPT